MKTTDPIPGFHAFLFRVGSRPFLGLATVLLLVFALATTAGAEEVDFEIVVPIDTVVRAPEGSETILSVTATPEDLIGETCAVTAKSENQSSVHPGNDLVVEASTRIVLEDVEAEPGGVVTAAETLVLTDEIVISLIMGPDEVFSAGIEVRFDCPPEETTTTTSEATTTTSEATTTTTSEATTTTLAGTTTTTDATTATAPETTTTTSEATTTTSEATTTTIEDEVIGTRVLPFTGPDESTGLFALTFVASGLLLLVGARTIPGSPAFAVFSSRRRCVDCGEEALFKTPHGIMCLDHTRRALDADSELWLPRGLDEESREPDDEDIRAGTSSPTQDR